MMDALHKRIEPLLAPLSPEPCGTDAKLAPDHEAVRAEISKLESPGAPPVQWAVVVTRGSDVLAKQSKDLVIAAYLAHALLEQEGPAGLAAGLLLVNTLLERDWERCFPPLARIRGRAGAIGWWVERSSARLPALSAGLTSELIEVLASQTQRLAEQARARFGDSAPAVGPLRDAIERARLAAPLTTSAAAAPAAAAPAIAAPAPSATPVGPPAATPDATTPAAAAAPSPAASDLSARAAAWLLPISDAQPAGQDARYDDAYARIRDAIKALDSALAKPVDWKWLADEGGTLLAKRSKDLLIAAHVAHAHYELSGLDGLTTGCVLLHELMTRFWDGLYPDLKRGERARANALAWFLARCERLAERELSEGDRKHLPQLAQAAAQLARTVEQRFHEQPPALSPLLSAISRLEMNAAAQAEASKPAVAPAVQAGAAPSASAAPAPVTAAARPVQPATPAAPIAAPTDVGPAPSVTDTAALNTFFSKLRNQLWDLANAIRAASDRDPLAYRLGRIASYLTLVESPPNTGGKTPLPAPPALVLSELGNSVAKKDWTTVVADVETSLRRSPFLLDLHRHADTAMEQLGPGYAAARRTMRGELAALIARVPELVELKFQDGTPFADAATRDFLSSLGGGGNAGAASPARTLPGAAAPSADLDELLELTKAGKVDQALDVMHGLLTRLPAVRDRFAAKLAVANACAASGSDAMAVALFEGLLVDVDRFHLDEWEPSLASEYLAGYHRCLRALAARDKEMAQAAAVVYRRLCRVDPKRALSEAPK